ncbi:MAG TPA: biotin/lipoyl-containing protein [Opitutaceae bacterium]|nr:biotin/lipoyl-containing protein [Opitutaceae bacterium]
MKKIDFMLTAFRDGFQSVFGARVFSKDYLPLVEFAAKECGITHFEAGGGALFQSPFFYANENAFEVMDAFRAAVGPKANLQTLARGINVVALKAQPRDIVKLHAVLFKKHGMTTIRNFDALNDVSNLIDSGRFITEAGLNHEMVVTMMELPPGCSGAHEVDFYEKTLRSLLDAGIPYSSICFKDASGTSRPQKVYETIKMARALLGEKARISFHSHETAGTCVTAYRAAIDAGADQIDLAIAPLSGGTSQPDIITMWHALRGTEFTLDIDINKILQLSARCKEGLKDYFVPPEATCVEPLIPFFPMPGGALTANTQMLRDNGLMDRYPEVIAAMGEAVRKGGFGTSVTPVSQFYFQQAFNNVMFGPWKKIADGYGRMVLGYFGKTPVAPDPEVVKIAAEQLKLQPTTDHLTAIEKDTKRGIAAAKALLEKEGLPTTDENIFIASACEEKGIAFLKGNGTIGVRKNVAKPEAAPAPAATAAPAASAAPIAYDIELNSRTYHVILDGATALVNGTSYPFGVKEVAARTAAAPAATGTGTGQPISTQLPGLVLRIEKPVGTHVKTGDAILVLESMKMETAIVATHDGVVAEILVAQGALVQAGQTLAIIR